VRGDFQMNKSSRLNNVIETARQRSNIYGFLSLIYRTELNKTLLQHIKEPEFLSVLSDMGAELEDDFLNGSEDKLIEDLAVEYTRLFLGPGKHISPHESVHHKRDDGNWGELWGKSTIEVKKFIEASGLEYKSDYHGLPDHISVELEFMQEASKREAQTREEKDHDGALYCLNMEKKFIDEHLIKWLPVFCDKVISEAGLSFYREMARITRNFMEFERGEIDKHISEAEKEKSP
jgi:TorA maturation chaperone TorD